jgi:CubicO group peptidase (beta-lactamase class C family)
VAGLPAVGQLTALLERLARRHRVPAAQLAVHVPAGTVGVATAGVGGRARFPIGSITKAFTATVAMVLAADGDVELDEPLGSYLDRLGTSPGTAGAATLRQVLGHTGGLPATLPVSLSATASPSHYLAACAGLGLLQPPGQGFSYSNVGYVLAGRVIEEITGMSWAEAVDSLLLRPLRIEPGFVTADGYVGERVVSGHAVHAHTGVARPVAQTLHPVEAPAGALALSARDLVAFGRWQIGAAGPDDRPAPAALAEVDTALIREPVAGAEPFGLADGWGLGLAVFGTAEPTWAGHDGTADGTSCHLRVDAAHGQVVALTTNASSGGALWEDLLTELRAAGFPVGCYRLPGTAAPAVPAPDDLAGRYANGDLEYVVEAPAGAPAALRVDGELYPALTLHASDVFSVRDPASGRRIPGGRVVRDPITGRVRAIQTGGRLARRTSTVRPGEPARLPGRRPPTQGTRNPRG